MHTRTTLLVTLITLLCASMALAAPTRLSQQGRLLDGDGTPLTGGHGLAFTLHDAETDGNEVWREERVVQFEEGYYSIILGTVTPLDDLLFAGSTVWLQLSVDGVELSPRQEVVSVPYALRATSAEHVDGGVVEAAEISVGGVPVINSTGTWIGPTPSVDWSELTGVPGDIADGDQDTDTDTLAGLACTEGEVPKWNAASGLWICGADVDTVDPNTDTLADLGLSCLDRQIARYSSASGLWLCDAETVTTSLPWNAITGVPGDIADGDQDTVTTSLPWSAITGVPGDIADGDADTDSLADLGQLCTNGDRPAWDASQSQWTCSSEQVGLDRIDSSTATADQVMTFDGTTIGWEDPASTNNPPCTLEVLHDSVGFAGVNCGAVRLGLRTWSTFSQVSAGYRHTCGLGLSGALQCWGYDNAGQSSPPAGTFTGVTAGRDFTCGVETTGALQCWGESNYNKNTPPSGTFTQVSAGKEHACALRPGGEAECWGWDGYGQSTPPSGTFSQISAGYHHTCAIDSSGSVQCWGRNQFGQSTPPSGTFTQVSAGSGHTCGVENGGLVHCWGRNNNGESTPPAGAFTQVSTGEDHSCGLDSNGLVLCWGLNVNNQSSPPTVSFSQVSAGGVHTCAVLDTFGASVCWGTNSGGQVDSP